MKIVIVYDGRLKTLPPALSLIRVIQDLGLDFHYVCTDRCDDAETVRHLNVPSTVVHYENWAVSFWKHPLKRIWRTILRRKHLRDFRHAVWSAIDRASEGCSDVILWSLYMNTASLLGDRALQYGRRHIHTFYELGDEFGVIDDGFDKVAFLKTATLVHCEPNRAEIFAAKHCLDRVPFVIPNAPYMHPRGKGMDVVDVDAARELATWGNRFVFLYQGVLNVDRSGLIEVLGWLCEAFPDDIVAIMTWQNDLSTTALGKYPNFRVVPFVPAPNHLQITSHAGIGVAYYARVNNGYSPLNAAYCAPNKIYEYGGFGIPILCNDVPGLRYTVGYHRAGVCFEGLCKESVVSAAKEIKANYADYALGAKRLYEATDLRSHIAQVLACAKEN